MNEIVVEAESVSKRFCKELRPSLRYGMQDIASELSPRRRDGNATLRPGEFWALRDVSFELRRGEALGIIGSNGAGKSTLLKLLNGLMKPDGGRITVRGRVGALIELGAGFSPILTGRENIYVNAAMLGLTKAQTDRIVDDIIGFAGLEEFIDTPVQNYSSGMWVRLGYAVATHMEPDVLLVDEVLAVGDLAFQRRCIQHMFRYLENGGSLVLVSHNMHLLQSVCARSLVLHKGRVVFAGTCVQGVNQYLETQCSPAVKAPRDLDPVELTDDRPVAIDRVDVRPLLGEGIRTGGDVGIVLRYRSAKDIDGISWGFGIWTGDQAVCITGDLAGSDHRGYRITRGYGELRCTIPRLPLTDGTYAVRAVILDLETRVPIARRGWDNAPSFFTVKSDATEVGNLHLAEGSLVEIEVQWQG